MPRFCSGLVVLISHISRKKAIIAVTKSAYATFQAPPWWPPWPPFLIFLMMRVGASPTAMTRARPLRTMVIDVGAEVGPTRLRCGCGSGDADSFHWPGGDGLPDGRPPGASRARGGGVQPHVGQGTAVDGRVRRQRRRDDRRDGERRRAGRPLRR